MTPKDFKVGQTIYVQPPRHRSSDDGEPEAFGVTKIGREYVTFGDGWQGGRFNPKSMHVDQDAGYSRKVWLSLEDYERDREREQVWREFHDLTRHCYAPPRHIDPDIIKRWIAEFKAATEDSE